MMPFYREKDNHVNDMYPVCVYVCVVLCFVYMYVWYFVLCTCTCMCCVHLIVDHLGGVMAGCLTLSVIDCGFNP
jgi:hypothetical protein